jgi:AcrR family transcriptional regulator
MSTAAPLSARQAKADDTRMRLFIAGAELLAAQGYPATSVEQIARRAGVAKGTFFLHFPTKDALVTDFVRLQVHHVSREHARMLADGVGPVERLRATLMAFARLSDSHIARAILVAGLDKAEVGATFDRLFQGVLELMTDDARDAIRAGELSRNTAPAEFAELLLNAFLGATLSLSMNARGRSLPAMLTSLVDVSLAAFAPKSRVPKGAKT